MILTLDLQPILIAAQGHAFESFGITKSSGSTGYTELQVIEDAHRNPAPLCWHKRRLFLGIVAKGPDRDDMVSGPKRG